MMNLNMENDTIYLRDIKIENLPNILKWYNKTEEFKFATGIDTPITLDFLIQRYAEVAISSSEFFVGIYIKGMDRMIGILKGRVGYRNSPAVWISSIVIDPENQRKNYGGAAVNMLLSSLKINNRIRYVYLAVVEDNVVGRKFWIKHDFKEIRRIENHIRFSDKSQNVIIMYKNL